ncbi:MAG: 23S rRNA (pseudouridine(1915)-N(3))-methyltransferase RlmH [Patescibacteria group bacterium]|jgi:23S rRNA (pseudouridine1915-N3)-methyltransferase
MFSFHIIAVSQNSADEYIKRLAGLAKLKITLIKPVKVTDIKLRDKIITLEGEKILSALTPESFVVICDQFGKLFTTVDFLKQVDIWSQQHTQTITFIVGGTLGLSAAVKQAAQANLGLAKWTLPHDLASIVLLEQLYRICTIQTGKTYHY